MLAAMLVLEEVSKRYAGAPAVDAVSLSPEPGRTTVLIGPSGSGKSTLLRLMIGLLEPDAGCVRFGGELLTRGNARALRRRMGYVIQEGGLFPHLSARDNAALMARHVGWKEERVAARLAELCRLTRFPAEALGRFPMQLSGGQRQRVALMRGLMLDPPLLLLDEPLGALDPMIRADLQAELRDIFAELGKTVVLVTHDLGEAAYLGHAVVLMRAGRVVQQGAVAALWREPAEEFVTRFVRAQRTPLEELAGGSA